MNETLLTNSQIPTKSTEMFTELQNTNDTKRFVSFIFSSHPHPLQPPLPPLPPHHPLLTPAPTIQSQCISSGGIFLPEERNPATE